MSNVSGKLIAKPAIILLLIAGIAAGILGVVDSVTSGPIAYQNELATKNALVAVFPEGADFQPIEVEAGAAAASAYTAVDAGGNTLGYVVEVLPSGFGGAIDLMVGVDTTGAVTGISVLSMAESPGLGARCTEDWFVAQFAGQTSPVAVTKDGGSIESLTSATITSRAIANGVTAACDWATAYAGGAN